MHAVLFAVLLPLLALAAPRTAAAQSGTGASVSCDLHYSARGWAAVVKKAKGTGTISCDNGQTAEVRISIKGGGLAAGKSVIRDGHGKFSKVNDIKELFGSYAAVDVAAGAVKEREGMALTKGEVSLALTGKGSGWELGAAFEKATIRPVGERVRDDDRR
jgi:hypothetical protein